MPLTRAYSQRQSVRPLSTEKPVTPTVPAFRAGNAAEISMQQVDATTEDMSCVWNTSKRTNGVTLCIYWVESS